MSAVNNERVVCPVGYAVQYAAVYQRVYGDPGGVSERAAVLDSAFAGWRSVVGSRGERVLEGGCECGCGCVGWAGARRGIALLEFGSGGGVGRVGGESELRGTVGGDVGSTDGGVGSNVDGCRASGGGQGASGACVDPGVGGVGGGFAEKAGSAVPSERGAAVGEATSGCGPNWARNRVWRQRKKDMKQRRREGKEFNVPEWRRGASASVPSLSGSVRTVDTRTAEEIEAARTFAARRVVENKIAIARGKHALASLCDRTKTEALRRLDVARVEERINTARARSQASFKKCGSPMESVGSAASAGEFAWKQEVRKRVALKEKLDYVTLQLEKFMKVATPDQKQAIAMIPEPHIPTDEEIDATDEFGFPLLTPEDYLRELQAEAVW